MNSRIWTFGGLALAVAVVASLAACDPYQAANTAAPQVWGVIVADPDNAGASPSDEAGCTAPYPQPNQSWADSTFPGLCVPGSSPSVCPVLCFPPRIGPAYAPFFTGNLGASYKTAAGPDYVYQVPAAYVLTDVPVAAMADGFVFHEIRIVFNKVMAGSSIQPNPDIPEAAPTLVIATAPAGSTGAGTPIVPADYEVRYVPTSGPTYLGASISILPVSGTLAPATRYTITGPVKDQQGNTLNLDVSVTTAP